MEPRVEMGYPTETPTVLTPQHIPQGEPIQRANETNNSPLTLLPPTEQQSEVESTECFTATTVNTTTTSHRVLLHWRGGILYEEYERTDDSDRCNIDRAQHRGGAEATQSRNGEE